ncbi:hypothetical protein ACFWP2_38720 [Kitasatospora sp. NPDC058444]|uniref:hypothetical protein n=1 Tax=Kitasatospora sp. NPDC058444 TaxID=3346504 RepID=UPI00364D738A
MTGVELVVAALAAGASAGLTDTASSAVRDTYSGLREAVRRRLSARGEDSAHVLEASEAEPEVWQGRLHDELVESGAAQDTEILAAALSLLRELGTAGRQSPGAQRVDARDAKGVQIGDHNTQNNTFN